jgi:hypothetical protein
MATNLVYSPLRSEKKDWNQSLRDLWDKQGTHSRVYTDEPSNDLSPLHGLNMS